MMGKIIAAKFFGIPLLIVLFVLCQVEAGVEVNRVVADPRNVNVFGEANSDYGSIPCKDDSKCKDAGGQAAIALRAATINGITRNCILCSVKNYPNHPFLMYYDATEGWIKLEYSNSS